MKTNTNEVTGDVTYRDGYQFDFVIGDDHIHAFGSAKSGKEKIFLNDKVIVEKRSFGRRSCLGFSLNGMAYEIEFYLANMLTGELHCSLIENGTHVKTLKKSLKKHYQLTSKRLYFWLPLSVIIGFFGGSYLLPALINYFSVH